MVHLVIAGHGKQRNGTFDPGASGYIKKGEHKYVVEDLFPAIRKHLPKGHNVVLFSKYKVSNYGNIAALAKEYKATQITEIHFDASGPSASGGHVIIHKSFKPDKMDLALRDAIDNIVGVFSGYNHKGYKGVSGRDNLLNVNQTARAGITYRLIELGFGSNKRDADILVKQVDQYAKELVKAITGKVSEKPTEQASKPQTKPKPSTPSKDKPKDDEIKVDGLFGPKTARKAQRVYGLDIVDGVVSGQPKNASTQNIPSAQFGSSGSALIYEMQKEFAVPAKYRDGKITVPSMLVGNMQKNYGTTVDNVLSKPSLVIMEWQKALNKGKRK